MVALTSSGADRGNPGGVGGAQQEVPNRISSDSLAFGILTRSSKSLTQGRGASIKTAPGTLERCVGDDEHGDHFQKQGELASNMQNRNERDAQQLQNM